MGISNVHNLRSPPVEQVRPYGLRVSLPSGDPLRKLLGPEWHRIHWYATAKERDADKALKERQKCLAKLAQMGDIPPEVLMSLPSPEEIQRRAQDAAAKTKAARLAMLASRTNTVLSIPMLYCMVMQGGVGG